MILSMVKKAVLGATGSVALLVAAASAHATPIPVTYVGMTILTGPPVITCTLTLTGTVDDMTGEVVVSGGMVTGPGACSLVILSDFPWTGTISSGMLDLETPHATVPGVVDCQGTVAGIEVVGSPIPSSFIMDQLDFGTCSIDGRLDM